MTDTKELTEQNLDGVSGGIMCPDGIERALHYDRFFFCPNCYEKEEGKLSVSDPCEDGIRWVYCVHCGFFRA